MERAWWSIKTSTKNDRSRRRLKWNLKPPTKLVWPISTTSTALAVRNGSESSRCGRSLCTFVTHLRGCRRCTRRPLSQTPSWIYLRIRGAARAYSRGPGVGLAPRPQALPMPATALFIWLPGPRVGLSPRPQVFPMPAAALVLYLYVRQSKPCPSPGSPSSVTGSSTTATTPRLPACHALDDLDGQDSVRSSDGFLDGMYGEGDSGGPGC
jgi:hypothetical protein